jgi:hypothetical protein
MQWMGTCPDVNCLTIVDHAARVGALCARVLRRTIGTLTCTITCATSTFPIWFMRISASIVQTRGLGDFHCQHAYTGMHSSNAQVHQPQVLLASCRKRWTWRSS